MPADFRFARKKKRHIPAKTRSQYRVGIDIDEPERPRRQPRFDFPLHVLAQRAAVPGVERELTHR